MLKIKRILIANRGEIVNRIIDTCREMNIETVAIFSDIDKDCDFVGNADFSYCIGNAKSDESYNNIEKIIEIAKKSNSDAIHPGYGFLSENAEFALKCEENNIIFIGPDFEIIEKSGDKIYSRKIALSCNVPIIPAYEGITLSDIQNREIFKNILKEAEKITYPLMIKASSGGGGKGIRIVHEPEELYNALISSEREASLSFKNSELLLEKYFPDAKHIEVQILGDKFGNIIHLGERECSVQRRFQKIIEETPSHLLSKDLKNKLTASAIKIAEKLNYNNAGTVEFIVNPDSSFYFLEINSRLQVEHTITETSLNVDLVKMQIEIAQENILSLKQDDIDNIDKLHSIECRIYAEDTDRDFSPSNGVLNIIDKKLNIKKDFSFLKDKNTRIDSGFKTGDYINHFYDPMIAKIICYDKDRYNSVSKMVNILKSFDITGIKTNKNFILQILSDKDFIEGKYNTSFIKEKPEIFIKNMSDNDLKNILIALLLNNIYKRQSKNKKGHLKNIPLGWRNLFYIPQKESYLVDGVKYSLEYKFKTSTNIDIIYENTLFNAEFISYSDNVLSCLINSAKYSFYIYDYGSDTHIFNKSSGYYKASTCNRFIDKSSKIKQGNYNSPLPGEIIKIHVKEGEKIIKGQNLLTIYSMKMENTICALENGSVKNIFVQEKSFTDSGSLLLTIDPESE